MAKILRNIVKCLQCEMTLESTHRHHLAMCECPNQTFADGGKFYLRRGGMDLLLVKEMTEYEEVEKADG